MSDDKSKKGVLNEHDYDEIAKRLRRRHDVCSFTKEERRSLHRMAEAWQDGAFIFRRILVVILIVGILGILYIGITVKLPSIVKEVVFQGVSP